MTEKCGELKRIAALRAFGISQSEPATTNFSTIQNLLSQVWTLGLMAGTKSKSQWAEILVL